MTEPPGKPTIHKGSVGDDDLDDLPGVATSSEDDDVEDDDVAAADDEDDDAPEEATPPSERPASRMRIAPLLFVGAALLWGGAMALRCRPAPPGPSVALPTGELAEAEPEQAIGSAGAPEAGESPVEPGVDDAPPVPMADAEADAQPDAPTGDAPAGGDRLPQHRDDWAAGLELPTKVRYTIRRGGSLKNVANLFKIFHHEILELNPGIGLEQELPPNSRVVVYSRKPDEKSESIGFPSDGSLGGAIPMVEGPGRRILAIGWKTWGKDTSIAMLDAVLDRWAKRGSGVQDILVGNISNRTGGRLEPHSTHQSGRDVDLGYPQKLAAGAELNWQEMNAANLDAAETWALLFLLGETGAVEEIYIDREIQKLLHQYAVQSELLSKSALAKWMEYPRPTGTAGTLIAHVPGHTDHMHVRWSCVAGDTRCKSR